MDTVVPKWDLPGINSPTYLPTYLPTTTQTCTNRNHTICMSHSVLTLPFMISFVWLSGSSVCTGALSPTGYELSWSLCCILCLSELICVHLSLSVSFVSCALSVSSVTSEVICIENLSLHSISLLWGLLSFCSLLCTHLSLMCWDLSPHFGLNHSLVWGSTKLCTNPFHLLWWEDQPDSTLSLLLFSFCHHYHHHLLCLLTSFLSITCCSHLLPHLSIHFV